LDDWQTLIAGTLALIAAVIGAIFLRRQIRQTSHIENSRRERKQTALRAVGPLAMAAIVEYAIECSDVLKRLYAQCQGQALPQKGITVPTLPPLPSDTIERLAELVEYSRVGETDLIEDMLSDIQVQRARLRGTLRDVGNPNKTITRANIESYIIDTGQIYARAAASLDFFRRTSATLREQIDWNDVRRALNNLDFYDTSYPSVYAAINLFEGKGISTQRFRPSTRS
jgi:hypothetical protein